MKVCYVLSYKAPRYIRSQSILHALRQISGIELHEAINSSRGMSRYLETFKKAAEIKRKHDPDVYFLGFRGHEFYWPLRQLVGKKPIILDALMSPYASLSRERKYGVFGVAAASAWRAIEHSILHDANFVLTDTTPHVQFYQQEFSLQPQKLLALPVGAKEPIFDVIAGQYVAPSQPGSEMNVLFYGSFLPLHGVEIIIKAASLLQDLPICFDFVGGSETQARTLKVSCESLGVRRYTHRRWLSFDGLINETIPHADLCLGGPFGDTEQARRVITGKTSQCLALGKPTVIGMINEDIGFVDKQNCLLVPQGNYHALADSIRWAFERRDLLASIGERGKSIYAQKLSLDVIRQLLGKTLSELPRT